MSDHDFFTSNGLTDHGESLFDHIEGFLYFVKDTQFRFVAVNQRVVEKFGCKDAQEVIGKTDYDFVSLSMADAYAKDDRTILETGIPSKTGKKKLFHKGVPTFGRECHYLSDD